MRFDYELPEGQQFSHGTLIIPLAVSPDGSQFVYGTTEGLYLRSVDALDARLIPGTDKDSVQPFFSPDGQWIGYCSDGSKAEEGRHQRRCTSSYYVMQYARHWCELGFG